MESPYNYTEPHQAAQPVINPGIMQRVFNIAGHIIAGAMYLFVVVWLLVWIVKGFIALVNLIW